MNDLISLFKSDLLKIINDLESKKIIKNFNLKSLSIDYSSKSKKGDLSTNIYLLLIKKNLDNNFNLKDYIINYIFNLDYIENINVAKGFVNVFIKKKFLISKIKNLFNQPQKQTNNLIHKQNINIEFVSANPTGPVHIAHIRGAVLGDVLASILKSVGHNVTREYYVNDAGSQITILGNSLYKRYQQLFSIDVELSEGEYPGEYLIKIAKKIKDLDGKKWLTYEDQSEKKYYFESFAINLLVKNIKKDLALINIIFDNFTYESQIVKDKFIDKVFKLFK